MSGPSWDPGRYLRYADERGRPFLDLISRIAAVEPSRVVDLGCGPGNLTRVLKDRWPGAEVVGLDSSTEMIAEANAQHIAGVHFEVSDLRDWQPTEPVDVLVSNATLQWVPGHLDLLPGLVGQVVPGGWFAVQVPGNFAEPSHVLLRELGSDERFSSDLTGIAHPHAHGARPYLEALASLGCRVDAWETTYLHVLHGADPVFTWISGTGARATLHALPEGARAEFEQEYKQLLREAYPPGPQGTVLPFRRVFAVAQVPEEKGAGGYRAYADVGYGVVGKPGQRVRLEGVQ